MIDLNAIRPGDIVTLADVTGNRAQGQVMGGRNGSLECYAFASGIIFARPTRTGNMVPVHGIRLLDHQPQLFPAA